MNKMKKQSEINIGANGTEYGNWMSMLVIRMTYISTAIFAIVFILMAVLWGNLIATVVAGALFLAVLGFALYLQKVRNIFSFHKGKLMDKIQQNLMEHLRWDGNGKVLDIGCGSGALSIRVAKTYENATVQGIDYYGTMWDYSESMCKKNAELEGVESRCTFQHGDAKKLEFANESFDAVVSNFVYHEVLGVSDKTELLLESLRVLKKDGSFAFQDYFDREAMFGDVNKLVETLKANGIQEVYYKGNVDNEAWMPKAVLKSFIIKDIGVLYGKK